jgi:hypothetical protein
MIRWPAAVAFALAAGCLDPTLVVLPTPIPVDTSTGGALLAGLSVDDRASVPVVVDTGTPLTVYDDGTGVTSARTGKARLFSGGTDSVARAEWTDIVWFATPLSGSVGIDSSVSPIQSVLGGDLIQRHALVVDPRGTSPAITFVSAIEPCGCELALGCQAGFPFALEGGRQQIALDGNLYTYPATRVVLDVCVEPIHDPVSRDQPCVVDDTGGADPARPRQPGYNPSGAEVRMLVATGFPGVALTVNAFDRLRGDGASAAIPVTRYIHLADRADDIGGQGLPARVATLGTAELSAMAIVSRELYYGPCGELARSRRQRRSPPRNPRPGETTCLITEIVEPCASNAGPRAACDDSSDSAPVAAIVELTDPIEVLIIDDVTPLMLDINADVRSTRGAVVEGVLGADIMARLVSTIDYPHHRMLSRCASDTGCLTYPRFVWKNAQNTGSGTGSSQNECSRESWCCQPNDIPLSNGGRCTTAGPAFDANAGVEQLCTTAHP